MSVLVSIRLSEARIETLKLEAKHHNKPLSTYIKEMLENFDETCMFFFWSGATNYKNDNILEEHLIEHGLK